MAYKTNNYDLIKPTTGEYFKIADFNNNADKIDKILIQKADLDQEGKILSSQIPNTPEPVKHILLWSGSWTTGTITVPGIRDYSLLIVEINDGKTIPILCAYNNGYISGVSGYSSGTGSHVTETIAFTATADGLCTSFNNANNAATRLAHLVSSSHGSTLTGYPVTAIYGVVAKGAKGDKGDPGPLVYNGSPMEDWIVEQGTSGNWGYRKWFSGILEANATIGSSAAITVSSGAIYISPAQQVTFPSNIQFVQTPNINVSPINMNGDSSTFWIVAVVPGLTNLYYTFGSGLSRTAVQRGVNIYANGRWK